MFDFKVFLEQEKIIDKKYWAGAKNSASGILLIAKDTKRICLAFRSKSSTFPECYSTIGGALKENKTLEENALIELHEETNFKGKIKLIKSYLFKDHDFKYQNFIGLIDKEVPILKKGNENKYFTWFKFDNIFDQKLHPGLRKYLNLYKKEIKFYL
jgi:NADH pyrophosphatase NudC (nudix superfamily)